MKKVVAPSALVPRFLRSLYILVIPFNVWCQVSITDSNVSVSSVLFRIEILWCVCVCVKFFLLIIMFDHPE
jgi:hypothetical protein